MAIRKRNNIYVTKDEYEIWLDMIGAQYSMYPDYSSSKMSFYVQITPDVHAWIKATAIENTGTTRFYGRAETWNEVRMDACTYHNYSTHGKGARDNGIYKKLHEIFNLLSDEFEG